MQSSTWGAWINRSTVNNLTTASAGNGVLDAYQGKVLNDNITNLKGKILWTNPNPYSSFAGQTITLDESMENYDGYCIIYNSYLNDGFSFNTGIIPKGRKTILIYTANLIWTRNIIPVNNTTITFENCLKYTTYGGTGTNDNYLLLPHYIIGYKTGLFS